MSAESPLILVLAAPGSACHHRAGMAGESRADERSCDHHDYAHREGEEADAERVALLLAERAVEPRTSECVGTDDHEDGAYGCSRRGGDRKPEPPTAIVEEVRLGAQNSGSGKLGLAITSGGFPIFPESAIRAPS